MQQWHVIQDIHIIEHIFPFAKTKREAQIKALEQSSYGSINDQNGDTITTTLRSAEHES